MSDENVQLMKRWFREVWNEGRIQTVYDLLAPDAVAIGQTGGQEKIHGPKDFVPFVERIRGAFPDINVTIQDSFAVTDKVVIRWSASMSHLGDAFGVAATGKRVHVTGITIARIAGGQIVEGWDNWDQLGLLQQIGAVPQSESVPLLKSA